eukprot:COSAG04_NODE_1603_length_6188_cov_3.189984_4_plen_108_part_00
MLPHLWNNSVTAWSSDTRWAFENLARHPGDLWANFVFIGIEADGNCGLYALSFAEELLRVAGGAQAGRQPPGAAEEGNEEEVGAEEEADRGQREEAAERAHNQRNAT